MLCCAVTLRRCLIAPTEVYFRRRRTLLVRRPLTVDKLRLPRIAKVEIFSKTCELSSLDRLNLEVRADQREHETLQILQPARPPVSLLFKPHDRQAYGNAYEANCER